MSLELKNSKKTTYLLITAAKNEAKYIEKTLQSVISQTILPVKWVIVSDGSTDGTDEIVKRYAAKAGWIEILRAPDDNNRNFARKVYCFNLGYEKVKNLQYDIIVNLDGDVSFEKDYFEYLIDKFEEQPEIGVAGTPYLEGNHHSFKDSYVNIHHVHGQVQMFRRSCFENIGGYTPIKGGGIDWVAVTTARMKGWKTYSFQDKTFIHHRGMGTGNANTLMARFNSGKKDYLFGNHPFWELLRAFYQMKSKPLIIGGFFLFSGYLYSYVIRIKRPITQELMEFNRSEQKNRIKNLFKNKLYYNLK